MHADFPHTARASRARVAILSTALLAVAVALPAGAQADAIVPHSSTHFVNPVQSAPKSSSAPASPTTTPAPSSGSTSASGPESSSATLPTESSAKDPYCITCGDDQRNSTLGNGTRPWNALGDHDYSSTSGAMSLVEFGAQELSRRLKEMQVQEAVAAEVFRVIFLQNWNIDDSAGGIEDAILREWNSAGGIDGSDCAGAPSFKQSEWAVEDGNGHGGYQFC